MPNFAYLGDVDKRIQIPRHAKPKGQVAAGSLGIADNQTAIYPKSSPGGWQIIGQSPATMNTLSVGCQVKFSSISLDEFNHYHQKADA
ncbi:carboxyltransferase domain-containing protein [Moritella viscosa]